MAGPGCPGHAGKGCTLPWATQPHLPACCLRAEGPREATCRAGGHCRRPGQAREGVLGRVSGRSWVCRACWEGPHPALGHPTPSAGVLAGCRGLPGGVLGVTGSWEGAAALDGISAILDCGSGADCQAASVCVAALRRYCRPAWRPRHRGTTEDHLNVERGQGKTVCAAGRGREGVRNMPRGWRRRLTCGAWRIRRRTSTVH